MIGMGSDRVLALRAQLLLAALVASSGGCGSDPVAPPTDPLVCDVTAMIADGVCDQLTACFGDAAPQRPPGTASCQQQYVIWLDSQLGDAWRAGIRSGRIVPHAEGLAACAEALADAPCATPIENQLPSACNAIFEGTVTLGGRCQSSHDCVSDLACNSSHCVTPAPRRECQLDCPEGTTCEDDYTFFPFCMVHGESADCGGTTLCSGYRFCVGATAMSPGRCQSFRSQHTLGEGETCPEPGSIGSFVRCRDGLHCAETARDASGTSCWICEADYPGGGSCHHAVPEGCPTGEQCQITGDNLVGRCTPLPVLGQPCVHDFREGAILCASGLSCEWRHYEPGTCVAALPGGAQCSSMRACASGICQPDADGYQRHCASLVCE